MDAERFIDTLKREQAQLALSSLQNPRGRDAFELGLISGLVQAYARMQEILEIQLAEAEGRLKPNKPVRSVAYANPYLAELDLAPVLPEQMGRRR